MTSRFSRLAVALSLATAGLAGCADQSTAPSSAAEVRARFDQLMLGLDRRAAAIGHGLPALDDSLQVAAVAAPNTSGEVTTVTESSPDVPMHLVRLWANIGDDGHGSGSNLIRSVRNVTPPQRPVFSHAPVDSAAWLGEQIFDDANYAGNGEFRVPTGLVCNDDQACAQRVSGLRLGVIARLVGDDSLDLDVVTGDDRAVAATFELAPDHDDLSADLSALQGLIGASEASGAIDVSLHDLPTSGDVAATISFPARLHLHTADLRIDADAAPHALSFQTHGNSTITQAALGQLAVAFQAVGKTPGKLQLPSLTFHAESAEGSTTFTGFSTGEGPANLRVVDEADTGARVISSASALSLGEVDGARVKLDPDAQGESVIRIDAGQVQVLAGQLRTE